MSRRAGGVAAAVLEIVAERMRAECTRFHRQIADLLRRDREAGAIPAAVDPARTALGLVALAEGLAYHVLIGLTPPEEARARVAAAIADVYACTPPDRLRPGPVSGNLTVR